MSLGDAHSMVLKQDGSVWVTGWNEYGQLGDGSREQEDKGTVYSCCFMQAVSGGVKDVTTGYAHSMMLKQDRSVWATGWNNHGQLGDGTSGDITSFVQVVSGGVQALASGAFHNMLLKNDGSVWATGFNQHGQLGDGANDNLNTFFWVTETGKID